jgi:hypothetical protein
MYEVTTALDGTHNFWLLALSSPIIPSDESFFNTANHLSCHALASPWRANVSSCEERTPPTLRETSSLPARAWRFVLLTAIMESVWHFRQNTATQHLSAHLPHSTASLVQEAGGPHLWTGEEICGTWYIFLNNNFIIG